MRNGARLFAVDPRRTSSVQWAELWAALDVGSDIALANAMGREIIAAGLENREFIEREIIDLLEMTHLRDRVVGMLPYGLQKRVELGRALALSPKLLLLDEPMAGLNLEEVEDMARFIIDVNEESRWGVTCVLVEHDMGVVMDVSHRVAVLNFGQKIAEGKPEQVQADPLVHHAYLGEEADVFTSRR